MAQKTDAQREAGITHPKMNGPRTDPKFLPHPPVTGQRQQRNGHPLSPSTAKPRSDSAVDDTGATLPYI
jgi:hypothetical protein